MRVPNGEGDVYYAEGWNLYWTLSPDRERVPIFRFGEDCHTPSEQPHFLREITDGIEGMLLARDAKMAARIGKPVVCLDSRLEYPKFHAYIYSRGEVPLRRYWEMAYFSDQGNNIPLPAETAEHIRSAIRRYWEEHDRRLQRLFEERKRW